MLHLHRQRVGMPFTGEALLLWRWACDYTAAPAVEAHMVVVNDHVALVNIRHIDDIDVGNGSVIEEAAASPLATPEANSGIAEAVVNAAVETDMWPPIAGIPDIETV